MTITAVSGTRRAIKELVDGTIRVQVDIDPRFRKQFFDLFPEIDMAVALAPLDPKAATPDASTTSPVRATGPVAQAVAAPNELAKWMHVNGYFRNPKLWAAMESAGIYTAEQHKEWVEVQPCYGADVAPMECNGDVCAHHTPSAALPAAGRGRENPRKVPDWNTVPLCHRHHRDWAHGTGSLCATREQRQKMVEAGVAMAAEQAKFHVKHFLKIESLRDLTLAALHEFEDHIGLQLTKREAA